MVPIGDDVTKFETRFNPSSGRVAIEVSDSIKRMLLEKDRQLLPLLLYIKDHENEKKGVSRQKVAKYMDKELLSSRVTTLNTINALLQEGILIDISTKDYQSNLKINPKFDFHGLVVEAIHLQFYNMDRIVEWLGRLVNDKRFKMEYILDRDRNVRITFGPYKG